MEARRSKDHAGSPRGQNEIPAVLRQVSASADPVTRIPGMRVGVVDVGSNTIRLLAAVASPGGVTRVREAKAYVGLGEEILRHGVVREDKLQEAATVVGRFARIARKVGAERIEVLVTAPGRQAANPDELLRVLARAARAPVRAVSAEEEGLLAYRGALGTASQLPEPVAVCDVGGGSTELVVGSPPADPSWCRSVDVGALRLTAAQLSSDPPAKTELSTAREAVERAFADVAPPRVAAALAVGGSARGVAALVGETLGEPELEEALRLLRARRAAKLAKEFRLDRERARLLPAGALLLREVVARLGVPLTLARGGLREGAATTLLAELEAA
jgi:exopolyphosphatase/guanosine-5'-triphosphate,3'-diphosphate pyrophosphatase